MTGIISESMYGFLDSNGILPNEQKGCKRQYRGTKDQLVIDKFVLKDLMKRHTNVAMGWVNYQYNNNNNNNNCYYKSHTTQLRAGEGVSACYGLPASRQVRPQQTLHIIIIIVIIIITLFTLGFKSSIQ